MKTPDEPYLNTTRVVTFRPIFILGLHRSGTSILYTMLSATGCFNPSTAYHLICYPQLLKNAAQHQEQKVQQHLTQELHQLGSKDRSIDKLAITADFPEEYGFHLSNYTTHMHLSTANLVHFTEFCQKIQFLAANQKPILLKNPFDFSNFLFIKKHFPTAQFIFIHRNPLQTLSSTLTTFQILFRKKNVYAARLSRIYTTLYTLSLTKHLLRLCFIHLPFIGIIFLTAYSSKNTRYYLKNITRLPQEAYLSITYENLCKHPQKTMEDILSFLQCTPTQSIDFHSFIKPRNLPLEPTVRRLRRFITTCMRAYCTMFNYISENTKQHPASSKKNQKPR